MNAFPTVVSNLVRKFNQLWAHLDLLSVLACRIASSILHYFYKDDDVCSMKDMHGELMIRLVAGVYRTNEYDS